MYNLFTSTRLYACIAKGNLNIWLDPISPKRSSAQESTVSARECPPEADARFSPAAAKEGVISSLIKMTNATSLKKNHEFRKLYSKGKSAASKYVVVYVCKNRKSGNRLGITVSTKLGGAVVRNRIRRRLKEIYRLNESSILTGYDIVIVARTKSRFAKWDELQSSVMFLFKKLGLLT